MKFLCVECDEAMSLKSTSGPDEGSMTVLFGCGSCGREIAMLTNAMETQMVHSLGVKIGGATEKAPPMEMIQSSLVGYQGAANTSEEPEAVDSEEEAGGCPFSAMVAGTAEPASTANGNGTGLRWTAEARERMERIPSFVRPMVERGIEDYAKANNVTEVDEEVLKTVRERFGF